MKLFPQSHKLNSIVSKTDDVVNYVTQPVYIASLFLLHILYFFAFFGILYVNPDWMKELTMFIEIIICVFLMIRFNPLRQPKVTQFDLQIIFSSALFLLTNIGIYGYLEKNILPFNWH